MSTRPSTPSRPSVPSRFRRRASVVAAVGIVLTGLGIARLLGAAASDPRVDDLVWWGAGVLLLLGPVFSGLAITVLLQGLRADRDLRLPDDRRWRDVAGADPWLAGLRPSVPPVIDVSKPTRPRARAVVTARSGAAPAHHPPAPPVADATRRATLDVLVVIDVSDSMDRTDPGANRFAVARRLVDLLLTESAPAGAGSTGRDRVGVVLFAGEALTLRPLAALATPGDHTVLAAALQPRRGRGPAMITAALVEATAQLTTRADSLPVVLLFTDGRTREPVEHLVAAVRSIPRGCLHVLHPGELPVRWDHVPVASRLRTGPPPADGSILERHLVRILLGTFTLAWRGM